MIANTKLENLHKRMREVMDFIDKGKNEFDKIKKEVQDIMADEETVTFNDKAIFTWKQGKPVKRFQTTVFKEARPEIYAEFVEEKKAPRRFCLKT